MRHPPFPYDFKVNDEVYYVIYEDQRYRIRKRRVLNMTESHINLSLLQSVFGTIAEAVDYVVQQLRGDISRAEINLHNAQEHHERLKRSLHVYQQYQHKDE